jgi:hypothetical protein
MVKKDRKNAEKSDTSGDKVDGTTTKSLASEAHLRWLSLVSSIMGILGIIASVIFFLESRSFQLKLDQAKRQYDERARALQNQLATAKQEYERHLASIAFRLGGKEQYVDVTDAMISRSQVPGLPPNIKRFDLEPDIAFFVADYPGGDWQFIPTNELVLTQMMVGKTQSLKEAGGTEGAEQLRQSNIYLFRHPDEYRIDLRGRLRDKDAAPQLTLFPVIAVEALDHKFLSDVIGAPEDAKEEIRRLLVSRSATSDPMTRYTIAQRLVTALDDMFRTDFAGKMLETFISEDLKYVTDYSGVLHRLLSVQKLRNVLVIESQLVFVNVAVSGEPEPRTIQVEEEIWFFNGPDRSFLVRALIPHFVGQPNKYDEWVRRWLGGFKFVW